MILQPSVQFGTVWGKTAGPGSPGWNPASNLPTADIVGISRSDTQDLINQIVTSAHLHRVIQFTRGQAGAPLVGEFSFGSDKRYEVEIKSIDGYDTLTAKSTDGEVSFFVFNNHRFSRKPVSFAYQNKKTPHKDFTEIDHREFSPGAKDLVKHLRILMEADPALGIPKKQQKIFEL
jgi:hypothetical protein